MCAAYGKLPTDPQVQMLSDEQLHWLQRARRSYLRELFDTLGGMLGTRMTSEEFHGAPGAKQSKEPREVASFPLAFLIADDPGQVDGAYRKSLKKPTAGSMGDGSALSPINMSDVFSPSNLRDMFSTLRNEASQALSGV